MSAYKRVYATKGSYDTNDWILLRPSRLCPNERHDENGFLKTGQITQRNKTYQMMYSFGSSIFHGMGTNICDLHYL